jgi:hypothetical protein
MVSDAEMAALNIKPADSHGEWNYTFTPPNARRLKRLFWLKPLVENQGPNLDALAWRSVGGSLRVVEGAVRREPCRARAR